MFTASSFVVRWLLCTFIVFAAYNVTGHSYYHWLVVGPSGDWALKTLLGWALLVVFAVFAMAIWRSMGPIGITLTLFILYALVWIVQDAGLINLNDPNTVTTVSEGLISTFIAIGVSLSHVKVRLTGQPEVRDVNTY